MRYVIRGKESMKRMLIFLFILALILIAIVTGNLIFQNINKEDSGIYEAKKIEDESVIQLNTKENDDRIKIVKKYIEDNIDKKILSSDIANQVNISTRHLNRLIEASEKSSVAELIRRTRIKHSKKLLKSTQLSMSEIAYQSGFSSSFHFSKAFKALEGVTPGAYRKDINK